MAHINIRHQNDKKKSKKSMQRLKVVKKNKGGGLLIHSPAVFSEDSEYIFLNTGWGLKVFSVKTGACVRLLEIPSDDEKVRTLGVFNINGSAVVLTSDSSHNAKLIYWDSASAILRRKVTVKLPKNYEDCAVMSGCLAPSQKDRSSQDLCLTLKKRGQHVILFYDPLSGERQHDHPLNGTSVGYSEGKHVKLSFGGPPDMRIMATIVNDNDLHVFLLDGSKRQFKCNRSNSRIKILTVCCHPMEPCVAVGDALGRCILFRNPLFDLQVQTVFHWHTLPCNVIAFTPAGSSMYTGGSEHVLVKWNVENPNVKHFLPRLPAPIVHISMSPDNTLVAVSTEDNRVTLVESNQRVKRVLQFMSWSTQSREDSVLFPAGLLFDPVSRSVVLNSRPGHIQFFCPETENITIVDICEQNLITQERNKVIVNTDVTRVALSSDSAWMATIETRLESDVSLELRLKLWQYQSSNKSWLLNSVVDAPHSGLVKCLRFRPLSASQDCYTLISTGNDSKFRLWSPTPIDSIYKKGVVWRCEGAVSYKERKVGSACFSQDGSLLAVAFEHILTLWSTEGLKFKNSLSRFLSHIKQVELGCDDCSHLLLATTENELTVWNLLTLRVLWTAQVNPLMLIPDPCSSYMAVISTSNTLFIFNPNHPKAIHVENNLCNMKCKPMGATFAVREATNPDSPFWLQKSIFYYIDSNQELFSIDVDDDSGSDMATLLPDEEKSTLFGDLKKVQIGSLVEKKVNSHPRNYQYGNIGVKAVNEFLKAPCHTMAPVSALCSSLIEAFVLSKKSVTEREQKNKMEVDDADIDEGVVDDSDSDVEMPKKTYIDMGVGNLGIITNNITENSDNAIESKSTSNDLFFIDLDEEVDNILNI